MPPLPGVEPPVAATAERSGGLTLRAFLIGSAWMFIVAVLIPYNDYYLQSTFITGNLLPLGAVLILAVTVLLTNLLWQMRLIGTETMLLLITSVGFATVAFVFGEERLNLQAILPLVAAGLCVVARGAGLLLTRASPKQAEDIDPAGEAPAEGPAGGDLAPPVEAQRTGSTHSIVTEFAVAVILVLFAVISFIVVSVNSGTIWAAPALILLAGAWPLANALRGVSAPALTGGELIVVWILMIVGSGIPSSGLVRYLYPHMVAPIYLASPENAWEEKVHPNLPSQLFPSKDPESDVVKRAYEGFRESELEKKGLTLWQAIPWKAWLKPTAIWLAFVMLCYYIMICISVILRRQWEDRERLNFPLTQLPVEMIESPRPGKLVNDFFRSKAMWIGFSIPVVVYTVNGLHKFYPSMPYIDTTIWVWRFFREKPWNTMDWGNMHIYFTVIGFTYLLPMEVAFSLWFWYFFSQMTLLFGGYFELRVADQPWRSVVPTYGQMGAYLAYFVLLMWAARRHIRIVLRRALLLESREADRDEAMTYTQAVWGIVASTLIIAGAAKYYLGVHFFATILCLGLMMLTLVVVSRIVSQGGVIFVLHYWRPLHVFSTFLGGGVFGTAAGSGANAFTGRTTVAMFKHVEGFFLHDLRETAMPNMMNAFKLGGTMRINRRKILWLIAVSIVIAVVAASLSRIFLMYKYGGQDLRPYSFMGRPKWDYDWVARFFKKPPEFRRGYLLAALWGGVFITSVTILSTTFYWWPVHPIGILLYPSYSIRCFWWSFFLGWLFKALIVKYGGGKTYRALRPAFLGLILGDCFIGAVWIVVGLVLDERVISILPG